MIALGYGVIADITSPQERGGYVGVLLLLSVLRTCFLNHLNELYIHYFIEPISPLVLGLSLVAASLKPSAGGGYFGFLSLSPVLTSS